MLRADMVRLLLTFGVIAVILTLPGTAPPQNPALYITVLSVLAFTLGMAEVLRDNAAQTVLPAVVRKDDLETANGRIWSTEQIMGAFVGPPLAGLLIAYSLPAPFALDALTFALAAALVWAMSIPLRVAPKRRSMRIEMAEGWHWMRNHPVILKLAVILGLMNTAAIMVVTMLVLFAQEVLELSAAGYGLLLTAGAAGGVLGGIICPAIAARLGRRTSLLVALTVMPCSYAMLAFTSSAIVTGLSEFMTVFAGMLWNVVTVSYRQRLIPDELLGRVNSIYRFFGWGMMPFGALAGGALISGLTPVLGRELALRGPFLASAIILALILAYALRGLRL